jgi:hypothetical protein
VVQHTKCGASSNSRNKALGNDNPFYKLVSHSTSALDRTPRAFRKVIQPTPPLWLLADFPFNHRNSLRIPTYIRSRHALVLTAPNKPGNLPSCNISLALVGFGSGPQIG